MEPIAGYGLAELFALSFKVWAIVLWSRYPSWAWEESGHSKSLWLLLLIVAFFLPCVGLILALWFIFGTSTAVRRVAKLGHRPGFPD